MITAAALALLPLSALLLHRPGVQPRSALLALHRLLGQLPLPVRPSARDLTIGIRRAMRLLPRHRLCLLKATATAALFARFGYSGSLLVGVRRTANALQAHAWFQHEQQIIIGELTDLASFAAISETTVPAPATHR